MAVLILEIIIGLLALVLNPRARRARARGELEKPPSAAVLPSVGTETTLAGEGEGEGEGEEQGQKGEGLDEGPESSRASAQVV